jgi:signal transduction histidine kinase
MLLVGILVFVFPLLYVWVTQNFYSTAYDNINTSEKRRVTMLHESIVSATQYSNADMAMLSTLVNEFVSDSGDISKIMIVDQEEDLFRIIVSSDSAQVGTVEKSDQLYRTLPSSSEKGSYIYETVLNGERTWQVFRKVSVNDNELYIFSQHSFAMIDSVMSARKQQSYFGLTAIFIFLIVLAYWLNRQVRWDKKHYILQKKMNERDMFSNMIAHEFRTPLTAIKGYSSFLEESKTIPENERRFATNIHVSAERLVVLVNDFLEVARLQSGKLAMKVQPVNMNTLLERVIEDLQVLSVEKNLKLELAPLTDTILFNTDADRMVQVLTNIITNSIKYTDSGTVSVECIQTRGKVTLVIKDSGMGISAEDQQKLFTPFTRVGNVDSTTTTGSGLGMWITSQIVSLMNGKIGVESIKGVGTHIIITFAVDS